MAIRKISELNNLLKYVVLSNIYEIPENEEYNELSSYDVKLEAYDKMLFETSYDRGERDEEYQYVSYNLTMTDIRHLLKIDQMWKILSNFLSGDISFGEPISALIDKDGHDYSLDNSGKTTVTMYAPLSCCNLTKFYHNTEFHNDIEIKENTNLYVKGFSTFDNPINGVALSACWADLAEYYSSDNEYDPGTLIKFGGEKEITIATDICNAVVTSKPGIMLNTRNDSNMVGIALAGRTPIKVIGKVKKFDNIILSNVPGIGIVNTIYGNDKVIGKALESSDDENIKLIECVTSFKLI